MCPCTGKQWLHVSQGPQTEQETMSTFMGNVVLLWGHWDGQQGGTTWLLAVLQLSASFQDQALHYPLRVSEIMQRLFS